MDGWIEDGQTCHKARLATARLQNLGNGCRISCKFPRSIVARLAPPFTVAQNKDLPSFLISSPYPSFQSISKFSLSPENTLKRFSPHLYCQKPSEATVTSLLD